MQLCRLIAPIWLNVKPKVLEGLFTSQKIKKLNDQGYGVYYLPNAPTNAPAETVDGTHIDNWNWVFVDYDCKTNVYQSKEAFVEALADFPLPPTQIIDSGGGVHAYWRMTDLNAISYLKLSRRLCRALKTDEAVAKIYQLMRLPGTMNTKIEGNPRPCELWHQDLKVKYTCEELDKVLPPLTVEDDVYCKQHFDKTYHRSETQDISDALPPKFGKLIAENAEAKSLFAGTGEDRSKDDYRLGHLMFASDFSRDEALSVLVNTAKALARAPVHRSNYAKNIVDKIWTYEVDTKDVRTLSPTVKDILARGEETLKGTRFPCHRLIDDTEHGFRLGQVMGIIGGSGVGKTTLTLNTFIWFAQHNPDYRHLFFSLEQPVGEIANRIQNICQGNASLYDKIHVVSNYEADGTYRNLTLQDIEDHILELQKSTGHKMGVVVIDHIGVLAKQNKNGENEGLIGICQRMKAFAIRTNTMLIMLSQAPREKAGIGDLELDKSAAYGTVFFESFCDYALCIWQPLKRVYQNGAPTVMAFKFAKIRHKKQGVDKIQEDVRYQIFFDPASERLRELTQDEEKSLTFYYNLAANQRKQDRKTDVVPYVSRREENGESEDTVITAEPSSNTQNGRH